MKRNGSIRTISSAVMWLVLSVAPAWSQDPGPGPAGPTGPGTGTGGGVPPTPTGPTAPGGSRTPSPFPRDPTIDRDRFPTQDMQRPIFLSGKVVLDDGTAPPEPVTIERVCNGMPRPEAYTDSKGRFSFQLGQNQAMMPDASVSSQADQPLGGGFPDQSRPLGGGGGFGNQRGISERDLMGCEIRAVLPGFRSEVVNLSGRRFMDNPDVGTIILRRLGNVEGRTFSATSAMAPKDAKKAYEKGLEATKKKKMPDARREFEKAVQLYPRYAAAWYELGLLAERENNAEEARKAYGEALNADSKFVKPYLQMAGLSARENKWQDVADTTDRILKLNPYDYPVAYFYNAVANLNLNKLDAAEKSAQEALKIDTRHQIPKLQHVMGVILAQKQDYSGAAKHMKSYLMFAPNAGDAEFVRKQLSEVEKLMTAQGGQEPAPPPQP